MTKSLIVVSLLALLAIPQIEDISTPPPAPLLPETGTVALTPQKPAEIPALDPSGNTPVGLSIPSIRLNAPVIRVGLNKKGEMDVPDGKTGNVGWYEDGTIPGEIGSAVFDAHVYAAFRNLRYAKVGDDVFVTDKNGERIHFRIAESLVYKVGDVPRDVLFQRNDAKRLNLITCAGKFSRTLETYTHRLIVYATLVEDRS